MASACVNKMLPATYSSYGGGGGLSPSPSPRVSFGGEDSKNPKSVEKKPDLESPVGDFEFRLDDPVNNILAADELFSDGKLVPLQVSSSAKPSPSTTSPDMAKSCPSLSLNNDPYLFSPKAPRCSSRWRELLGLKKKQQENSTSKTSSSSNVSNKKSSSIRMFLNRNSGSDPSLSLPLLKDPETESVSVSVSASRLSLSDKDLPRLSLDSDKPNRSRPARTVRPGPGRSPSPMRRAQQDPAATLARGVPVSADSPRMNSSGIVVFQSLERSSSSPSSFNGGRPRYTHNRGGMQRSYSANVVRVTPVLNVPVCSLRGSSKSGGGGGVFAFFSSSSSSSQPQPHKKDTATNSSSSSRHHQNTTRTRKEGS